MFHGKQTRTTITAGAALMAILLVAPAASADRLTDKDVKELLERIDNERDRFEDQLDGKLKRSIIRGPGGEVNVEKYLDDLQENVDKLKGRFTAQYAASAEVTTVLRQASDIHRYMSTLPPSFDGASEWNRLAASLGTLAAVYGTMLPLSEGQQGRRLNDGEVRKAADDIAKGADRFKKELDSSLEEGQGHRQCHARSHRQRGRRLEAGCAEAGVPRRRRPAGVRRSAGAAPTRRKSPGGRIRAYLSPAAQTAWQLVDSGLDKVAQGFGLAKPVQ